VNQTLCVDAHPDPNPPFCALNLLGAMEEIILMKILKHRHSSIFFAIALLCVGAAQGQNSDRNYPPEPPVQLAPVAPPAAAPQPVAENPASPPLSTPEAAPNAATVPDAALDKSVNVPFNADLWQRVRRGFAMPDLDSELVRDREQWYSSRPDYIFRMTERSRRYLYHVVQELERRNMPTELALLPFIESAFNPQAVSSAKAAGMWQFIPSTGKHFDLKQNIFRDDRRDVMASTRAALDYLQKLHGMFGDWHLALAAYNWGEGSVQRAIKKNEAAGLPTGYTDLSMPNETRYYVPKLQAVKNIVSNPEVFNSQLPEIADHPYFQSVKITRDIDVALAARLAEVRLEDFKALNPSANKPLIMAAGTPEILLPWDSAPIFQRNLESHKGSLASWTVWTAPSTMKTAEAAQRNGMSEADFREINRIPPGMLVKAGSNLLVPRAGRNTQDVTEDVADNGQIALAPEIVLKKRSVRALKRGDSVTNLARRYGLPASQVAAWNKMGANAALKSGQTVVLYLPERVKVAGSNTRRASAARVARGKAPARASVAAKQVKGAKPITQAKAKPVKAGTPKLAQRAKAATSPVRVAKR
jgi:membrane-bound lytic murein transglycosylase D